MSRPKEPSWGTILMQKVFKYLKPTIERTLSLSPVKLCQIWSFWIRCCRTCLVLKYVAVWNCGEKQNPYPGNPLLIAPYRKFSTQLRLLNWHSISTISKKYTDTLLTLQRHTAFPDGKATQPIFLRDIAVYFRNWVGHPCLTFILSCGGGWATICWFSFLLWELCGPPFVNLYFCCWSWMVGAGWTTSNSVWL